MHPGKESNRSNKSNVYPQFTSHIQVRMNNPLISIEQGCFDGTENIVP